MTKKKIITFIFLLFSCTSIYATTDINLDKNTNATIIQSIQKELIAAETEAQGLINQKNQDNQNSQDSFVMYNNVVVRHDN
ncbi:hypothetical protein [Francisella philomiragia]|uniref:hypothetical protein n=1 Tax=Francisella philomiragia TaxID=28110 RepID=UPI001C9DBEB4|nr:hypothetical protein [Francisella philomiragia]MBY7733945.1 hypothetical protein [Francisella philomiragia]